MVEHRSPKPGVGGSSPLTPAIAIGAIISMEVEMIAPIAMDKGVRFAIREGGRTVGSGVVTEIVA